MWFISLATMLILAGTAEAALRCNDCHGTRSNIPLGIQGDYRPVDAGYRNISTGGFQGNHRTHVSEAVGKSEALSRAACAKCHPGSDSYASSHRDGKIKLSSNINNSPVAARYSSQISAFVNRTSAFPQTPTPTLGKCSNVNCHFEKETTKWGGIPLAVPAGCNFCHNVPPNDGSHPAHFNAISSASGRTVENVCVKCHNNNVTFAHATSAGKRPLKVWFPDLPNKDGRYTGDVSYPGYLPSQNPTRNGTCTTLYCHSNGAPFDKGANYKIPTWGGSPQTCTSCHEGSGSATALSGRHGTHTDGSSYGFACERCHMETVSGSDKIRDNSRHVNFAKDVKFNNGGEYDKKGIKDCNNYCHSDAIGGKANVEVKWSDTTPMVCDSCHRGTRANFLVMTSNGHGRLVGAQWIRKYPCTYCHNATLEAVMDANGRITDGGIVKTKHLNGVKDVVMAPKWSILGKPYPSYSSSSSGKKCYNVYCHSDGTTNPTTVRPFGWKDGRTECNTCHGHPQGSCTIATCHDGRTDKTGKVWTLRALYRDMSTNTYRWPPGEEWKAAIPMFENEGAGTARANSHARHTETTFTCDQCHASTTINGTCTDCHRTGIPPGKMSEVAHLNADYHVNKSKDVVLRDGGSYNSVTKVCSNAVCHTSGSDPVWGESVNRTVICLSCHGTTGPDVDDFQAFNNTQGKINLSEWVTTGHGRYSSAGPYPASGNPAANFPGNPCWYCHDNAALHKDAANPLRLRMHPQFAKRFEKECGYCHMEGKDPECLNCHNNVESLAIQLNTILADANAKWPDGTPAPRPNHAVWATNPISCVTSDCHYFEPNSATKDMKLHNTGSPLWTKEQNDDVRSQYMMMGVCLQCHDDDSNGKCTSCHTSPADNPFKYSLGFDPGTGFIKPKKARATSVHFGYKHYRTFESTGGWQQDPITGKLVAKGTWKGGKFCWDCHDPHGDSNIFMIQKKVATETDGTFGIPKSRSDVTFTRKQSGLDYVKITAPYDGICNVCHSSQSKHFTKSSGDGHNAGRVCTTCHEHRFSDSHGDKLSCSKCHKNKPVPRHSGFGLPKDCTKCHGGTIGLRMDVMGQFRANSHHVQGVDVTNHHCYDCHWESTQEGLIDTRYHEGYDFKRYTTVKNAKVDLVIWGPGTRPTSYKLYTTAVTFLASNMSTDNATARAESSKLTSHCVSCHSDQNNDTQPFNDCKTPRQYAWDRQSIAARYSQPGVATWGKYPTTSGAAPKNVAKALSAHGNAVANQGGWSATTGLDGIIPNNRAGVYNVTCYDCHSSHGSKVVGVTSSYITFNGTKNGGNLKETQAGKGGYTMSYKASSNTSTTGVNPYNAGAGQCFDCHLTQTAGTTPWGFASTFGASAPVMGYKDTQRFGQGTKASTARFAYRANKATIVGGHLKASSSLERGATQNIDGLCTPCHDPHGVSPTLGSEQAYAVPLLKGTWMTSPYKEDAPPPDPTGNNVGKDNTGTPRSWGRFIATSWYQNSPSPTQPVTNHTIDRNTFGAGGKIAEDDSKFAGLCLTCHSKTNLTGGTETQWMGVDKVHRAVKGWGGTEHSFTCSKCHQPHVSGLPRLMQTNCLDYKHRGNRVSGGQAWSADKQYPGQAHGNGHSGGFEHRGYPIGSIAGGARSWPGSIEATTACHVSRFTPTYNPSVPPTQWPDGNLWNTVTPW